MKSDGLFVGIFRFIIFMIMLMVILTLSILIYRTNEEGAFESQCNQIIARSGGLTKNAYITCNTLSQQYYSIPTLGGTRAPLFWITTPKHPNTNSVVLYDKHRTNFGDKVRYEINAQLPIFVQAPNKYPFPRVHLMRDYRRNWGAMQGLLPPARRIYKEYTPFGSAVIKPVESSASNAETQKKEQHQEDTVWGNSKSVGVQITYDMGTTYSQVRRGSQVPKGFNALFNNNGF